MNGEWLARRTALNHDWLKNDFLRRLRAFIVRVEMGGADTVRITEFLEKHWPGWEQKSAGFEGLLAGAENALSPRQLFEAPPLETVSATVKSWLPDLLHALWLARTGIQGEIALAQSTHSEANRLFEELSPHVREGGTKLTQCSEKLQEFECKVIALGEHIGRLPHKVEVV